ncbi:DinB family protein [Deinococcus planocerae]|uniref:DinB family protein n=1 Tax=Deinococcus planocerae TaxID=1737569 RepID=UPI000C7ED74E|nr:DinB family protein [Deinococcus planocerae]
MDLLDRLLGHDAWTTGRLIEQSRSLTDAQLDQEFDLGWRTVRATLGHIIGNMEVWTNLMNGLPERTFPEPAERWLTLDALQERLDTVAPRLADLARRIQAEGRLDDLWTFRANPFVQFTFGGALAHVVTHSMHHRAQLIHMLKRLGVPDVIEGDVLSWEESRAGAKL